jgi:putative inorganic carbon (HCO3(-)) transporter
MAVAVALACWPSLPDAFELPKASAIRLGVGIALLLVAIGAVFSTAAWTSKPALAVLAFFAVNVVATLWAVQPRTALLGTYNHDQGLVTLAVGTGSFFLAASVIRSELALARLATAFTAVAGGVAVYAASQYLGFDPLGWPAIDDGRRTSGTLGHPNQLAEFLAMLVPLACWVAWTARRSRRSLVLATLGMMLVAIILTQCRVAWIALLIQALSGAVLVAGLRMRWLKKLAPLAVFGPPLAAIAIFGLLLTNPSLALEGDALVSQLLERGSPLRERLPLWQSAVAMIGARPWLGWGPDTFELVYPGFRSVQLDQIVGTVSREDAAHNILLQVGVNAGLTGLLAFVFVQAAVAWRGLRSGFAYERQTASSLRLGLFALTVSWMSYLVLFVSGQPRVATDWLQWVVGGAIVGLSVPLARPAVPWRSWPLRLGASLVALGLFVDAGSALGAEIAFSQANAYRDQRAREEARDWLQRASALRLVEPIYLRELGNVEVALGRDRSDASLLRSAVDRFVRASRLSGDREPYTLSQLAGAEQELEILSGPATDAPFATLERAIALDPENPLLYTRGADLALRANRPDLARQYWEAARARSHSVDADQRLGEVAARLGDDDAARAAFRRAAEREWRPGFEGQLYLAWGDAALRAGDPAEAAQAYGQALERGVADELTTRLHYAGALAASGQRKEALSQAERLLEEVPTDPAALALVEELREQ